MYVVGIEKFITLEQDDEKQNHGWKTYNKISVKDLLEVLFNLSFSVCSWNYREKKSLGQQI